MKSNQRFISSETKFRFILFRCNDYTQYENYVTLTDEIYQANANTISKITGCLCKCDKYYYKIIPKTEVIYNGQEEEGSISINLYHPTGETEVMKQVIIIQCSGQK